MERFSSLLSFYRLILAPYRGGVRVPKQKNSRVVALPLRAELAELRYTEKTATWYSVREFR